MYSKWSYRAEWNRISSISLFRPMYVRQIHLILSNGWCAGSVGRSVHSDSSHSINLNRSFSLYLSLSLSLSLIRILGFVLGLGLRLKHSYNSTHALFLFSKSFRIRLGASPRLDDRWFNEWRNSTCSTNHDRWLSMIIGRLWSSLNCIWLYIWMPMSIKFFLCGGFDEISKNIFPYK